MKNDSLNLHFLGQFRAILGAKKVDNMRLWLRQDYHKYSYRNHRIKNIVLDRFRAIEGCFDYSQKWLITRGTISGTYTNAFLGCKKFDKLFLIHCQNRFNKWGGRMKNG